MGRRPSRLLRRLLLLGALTMMVSIAALALVDAIHPREIVRHLLERAPWSDSEVDWLRGDAELLGLDAPRLEALADRLVADGTNALIVARGGTIVLERYSASHEPDERHYLASLAKAVVGGTALSLALADGRLTLEDPVSGHVPSWAGEDWRGEVTIRQLATHTASVADVAEPHSAEFHDQADWKRRYWTHRGQRLDLCVEHAASLHPPGSRVHYSNVGQTLLTWSLSNALRDTDTRDIRELLRERLMLPLGVPDAAWRIGYGECHRVDGARVYITGGGADFTARAVARIGQLMLQRGRWQGRQLIDETWARIATSDARPRGAECPPGNPAPGLGWWSNSNGAWPELPRDAFAGAGHGHEVLIVVPSLDLVIVRLGRPLESPCPPDVGAEFWRPVREKLLAPLMAAVRETPPSRIEWAPRDTIVRSARGSDNWPLTWAEDDAQYTAYGDGWGFEPLLDEKLSLGLARVTGAPPQHRGENLRARTVERVGDDVSGLKASGILALDGSLYLFVRNANNSCLAWSDDRGATWTWAPWRFETSFGCPTPLNFAKGYAGARDDFVYIYSPDSDTAYEAADRMVLARVHRTRIREREAYEFLERLSPDGSPVWTKEVERRGAVLRDPGRCFRSGVTYDAGLGCYLWVRTILGAERWSPIGLVIHQADEPWGPWRTIHAALPWDVRPGESASFPTRWMSTDGRELWLVFSGDDSFSVRRAWIRPTGE